MTTEWPGTELDVGYAGLASNDFTAVVGETEVAVDGGGKAPPERNDGHNDRSSGNEVPPLALGERCDKIAAASSNWTCWCLLSRNFDASRQCGECSQRCLIRQDGCR